MDGFESGARGVRLRTVDVAGQSGYSVQQVRDLERLGVIPAAARADNGYRSYTAVHVRALSAYRGLAGAMGPADARRLLAELRTVTLTEVASAVNEVHVRLARERHEALRALRALEAIRADKEIAGPEEERDTMTITELSTALGVRPSTLRFWEQEGLVTPDRVTSLRARRYGLAAIRAARIVAALRGAGYGIPAVREAVDCLHRPDGPAETRRVLLRRLDRIALRTVALLRAGADLAEVATSAAASPAAPDA
ncbi:MerR family transcriptional regulator [Streptomyces sp. CB00455]|uniref:MerR family transcriptional regulator n=1 Tax=Streptomyces sp. CB00455 TaxID=1703927 RepID=UPI0009405B99|nr:MerR family transcriptional regulator [Streptomyces sp. CB00455]OKK22007.1 MerR family transcriptional regulator [Streptomyces sp. CB00455]